jgi:hypothetical protein
VALKLIYFWLVLTLLGSGCAPSRDDVVGVYSGAMKGYFETLEVRADGTFSQRLKFPPNQMWTQEGTWTLKYKALTLNSYLWFYNEEKDSVITPELCSGFIYGYESGMLVRELAPGVYKLDQYKKK